MSGYEVLSVATISSASSYGVLRRSGCRFTHEASAVPRPGQALHDLPRHRERVLAKQPADAADRADLHGHAQPVRVRTPQRDQIAVVFIEEEEPLQLRPRGHLGERPVRLGLLISQKPHRHGRTAGSDVARPAIFP